jgi:hypothetical protein
MENVYQENEIEIKDGPKIVWIRVQDAAKLLWSENPKLHSIGDLVQSIEKHGFQELPRYDINLPNASGDAGAIKAGNGRIETLAAMERDGMSLPRGLAQDKLTQAWVMPILVGTDADSLNAARAYAIDSNNLTMSGGDFTAFDFQRLWNSDQYVDMLKVLATDGQLPISVTGEDLDLFLSGLQVDIGDVTDTEDKGMGVIYGFRVEVGNGMMLEEVVSEVRQFLESHLEWDCKIVLST